MKNELAIKNSIEINASTVKVWDALINPEQTKKYMFGCAAISDWKPGSPLVWKGIFDGKELIAVKGTIVSIEKERFLAYTTIDPNSSIADIPENYTTVTYSLLNSNGKTTLTVTQGDFAKVADGTKRFEEVSSGGGWDPILVEIKKLVENAQKR